MVYSVDELASRVGISCTGRTILSWHADGLLPPPVHVATGKEGKPPLRFSDAALPVVTWLAQYRASINRQDAGPDSEQNRQENVFRTKVWLWMENLYTPADRKEFEALITQRCNATLQELRATLAGWPDGKDAPSLEQKQALNRAVQNILVGPLEDRGRGKNLNKVESLAQLGLGMPLDTDITSTETDITGTDVVRVIRAVSHRSLPPIDVSSFDANYSLHQFFRGSNLATLGQRPLNPRASAQLWRVGLTFLNLITNASERQYVQAMIRWLYAMPPFTILILLDSLRDMPVATFLRQLVKSRIRVA